MYRIVAVASVLVSTVAMAQSPGVNPGTIQPPRFNWCGADSNDYSKCTPVKDQGQCGSCWAFATTAVMENLLWLSDPTPKPPDLSEQYILACNPHIWTVVAGGCSGGFASFNMFTGSFKPPHGSYGGVVYEADFPYTATNGTCNSAHTRHEKLQGWVDLPEWSDVRTIKEHMSSYGPIYAEVCIDQKFVDYKVGTIFHDSGGCIIQNHAVVLVGWNDNNGDGYWILRNSWGRGWGDRGYMHIAYGANIVGAHAVAAIYKPRYPLPPTYGCSSTSEAGLGFGVLVLVVLVLLDLSRRRR